jgi:hypothetical protein
LAQRAYFEHVVESILQPSQVAQEGYRSQTLLLESGKSITAIVRNETDEHLIVVVPGEESVRKIPLAEIEARSAALSIMPAGLVNQLQNENKFFDLVKFLVELGKDGPERASRWKPDGALLAAVPLPEYESHLDHAGIISEWDEASRRRGKVVYENLCANCHGTLEKVGSLPNSLRFGSEKFRNGSDPLSMYRTLTHGYRMMLPQPQLMPQQKYDVINFIRESYLKSHNATQYSEIDKAYMNSLPKGVERGPQPILQEPWRDMDYGPFLINTYELVGPETLPRQGISTEEKRRAKLENRPPDESWPEHTNFAYKGIAIQLDENAGGVAAGSHWLMFDHDTMRVAGAWSGTGFIDWNGILLNGRHGTSPRTVGTQHFANPIGPGWGDPQSGTFADPRTIRRDGRRFGPLPREWAHYKGLYKHGSRVVLSYSVGDADVLESYRIVRDDDGDVWIRCLNIGESSHDLTLRVVPADLANVAINGPDGFELASEGGFTVLKVPKEIMPVNFELRISANKNAEKLLTVRENDPEDLRPLTKGGPAQWEQDLRVVPRQGSDSGPFAVDTLTRPIDNPWKSRLRTSGLDFLSDDDRLVACCCDGDVWTVDGINQLGESITWKRIASGLFQPLGVKIYKGRIHVGCRDQIVILNDLNGDGETDFYESFNSDHQVTDHFHEFAMGLQTDGEGNFFYAKSARHARDSLVPHHGTVLRVSADGRHTEILANGLRAANGICLNPDGSLFVTDQEGHWTPMNRINRVVEGGFYGNMYSFGAPDDVADNAMLHPICWPTKSFDRSPAELVWVDSERWGPLKGLLLNLSYGYGQVYVVPHEKVGNQWQGGMSPLPSLRFPTGIMRARFHPRNGQMYACGLFAWSSNQQASAGGLYRLRYTGKPAHVPIGLAAEADGIKITFSESLDPTVATDPENFLVETWSLKRAANYGSELYDEKVLEITRAILSDGDRSVTLLMPEIKPTWGMQISYDLSDAAGNRFSGVIQNTIHNLRRK